MYFRLLTPTGNRRGPVFTENVLRALHQADHRRHGITLRLDSIGGSTQLGVEFPADLRAVVISGLQDSYPGMEAHPSESLPVASMPFQWECALRKDVDVFSLMTSDRFTDEVFRNDFADPLSGVLSSLQSGRAGRMGFSVELSIRPATKRRLKQATRLRLRLRRAFWPASAKTWYLKLAMSSSKLRRAAATLPLLCSHRSPSAENDQESSLPATFECHLVLRVAATENVRQIALKRLSEIAGTFARFQSGESQLVTGPVMAVTPRRRSRGRGFLMNVAEIASMWHPPTETTDSVARVSRGNFRELEPPNELAAVGDREGTVLGRVVFRNERTRIKISHDDLRRHLFVIGKTGTGKSTFLLNVVRQQMESGRGVILIDPHGQLADEVLSCVPKRRKNDVVNFDVSNVSRLPAFNPMVGPSGADPTLTADAVLTSFKNVFGFDEGSAPRLLHIFRNCLLALVGTPEANLASVQRLLIDELFRKSLIARISNDAVREFWLTEFQRWSARDRTQYIASLQNKLGAFTTNERLNTILNPTTKRRGIVLRDVMDSSKILICNLSKGQVGHDASKLLGSLLLSSLQVAAMSRADIPEHERTDCTVVIDEFHSYLAEGNSTMADALAESRKYRSNYVLSTQMLDGQLDSATLAGVLGNCGSSLCMTVGPKDGALMAELLGKGLTPEDLMQIPKFHGYLRLLVDGVPKTMSIKTTLAM
ncbi:MAG: DUF87 domain-containing protein [Fuerstiella sp.]